MCPVCYTNPTSAYFVCGHGLCKTCAVRWLCSEDTCPMCRAVVGSEFVDVESIPTLDHARRVMASLEGRYTCSYDKNVFITGVGVVSWVKKNACIN